MLNAIDILGGEVGAMCHGVVQVNLTSDSGDGDPLEDEALLSRAHLLKMVNVLEGCRT